MSQVPSLQLDVTDLQLHVGSAAYDKGRRLADRGAARWMSWDEDEYQLSAVVKGDTGTYRTTASFVVGRMGLRFSSGDCTCPMVYDCKHVAAVAITAARQQDNLRVATAAKSVPAWERTLRAIIPASGADEWDRLGLRLSLKSESNGVAFRLTARPVQPGANGWVASGTTWHQLASGYDHHTHDPAQVRVLRSLYALYHPATNYYGYGQNHQLMDLAEFDSPHLWALLDEARAAGIAIMHDRKHLGDVPPPTTAEFCLDVTKGADGSLTLRPQVRLTGPEQQAVTPMVFLGTDAHGLAYALPDDREIIRGQPRIRLARFDRTVPQQLHVLALAGESLTVPKSAAERFSDRFLFPLQRRVSVISTDGSFHPPAVSGPVPQLTATFAPDHRLSLGWAWRYDVAGSAREVPIGPSDELWRDHDAEAARARELSGLLAELAIDAPLRQPAGDGFELTGVDAMRFATEAMPLLDGHDGLSLLIEGDLPDYREVNDQLTIGVSTAARDDPDWFDLDVSVSADGAEIPLVKLIAALTRDETHLLLDDGGYVALDKPELQTLRKLIEEARALQDSNGPLGISRFQAGLWDELAALGVVHEQAAAWQEQVGGLLSLSSLPTIPAPANLAASLRPYQLDGFQWLAFLWRHRLGGILADDMGLGKTVQSLALICHAKAAEPDSPPMLIVAPTSVVPNWVAEAQRFAPDLNVTAIHETRRRRKRALSEDIKGADIVVTSYTLYRLDYDDDYATMPWSALILDEAQAVKNHQSKTYQAVRKLPAPFKLAITGTPMENNVMELWSLLSITAPGLFPTPGRFEDYYARPIEKGGDGELLGQLRHRIRPLMKRRTKEQVARDLPDKQEQVLEVELHSKHRRIYDRHLQRERQKVLGLVDDLDKNRFTILRSLTLLRQLSLHAGLVDDANLNVPSAKIEALLEQIEDVVGGGHRALIFSQFTGFLGRVRDAVTAAGYEHCYLDGKTKNRARVLDEFKNGDAPLFLISLKAGGFGLNLTEADYCFLLDPWWNPATEAQAIDRTHRIGQTKNVMVYRLIAKDTIEQKVMDLKNRKAALFASVMDEGNAFGSGLSAEDLRALFSPE